VLIFLYLLVFATGGWLLAAGGQKPEASCQKHFKIISEYLVIPNRIP
jgi:hypothetical protein